MMRTLLTVGCSAIVFMLMSCDGPTTLAHAQQAPAAPAACCSAPGAPAPPGLIAADKADMAEMWRLAALSEQEYRQGLRKIVRERRVTRWKRAFWVAVPAAAGGVAYTLRR